MKKVEDINSIMQRLPHRYPFLLIDRILEVVPGESLVALKNVTINEPFFQGHFPGKPIMPGVLMIEAMGQAGGILVYHSMPPEAQGQMYYFSAIDKVRFRRPVVPGDQLIIKVQLLKQRTKAAKIAGLAMVGDQLAAEAEMMAAIGE
jgi:beta-hydroxyacyl-ACP dehydratase FabZ